MVKAVPHGDLARVSGAVPQAHSGRISGPVDARVLVIDKRAGAPGMFQLVKRSASLCSSSLTVLIKQAPARDVRR